MAAPLRQVPQRTTKDPRQVKLVRAVQARSYPLDGSADRASQAEDRGGSDGGMVVHLVPEPPAHGSFVPAWVRCVHKAYPMLGRNSPMNGLAVAVVRYEKSARLRNALDCAERQRALVQRASRKTGQAGPHRCSPLASAAQMAASGKMFHSAERLGLALSCPFHSASSSDCFLVSRHSCDRPGGPLRVDSSHSRRNRSRRMPAAAVRGRQGSPCGRPAAPASPWPAVSRPRRRDRVQGEE